MLGMNNLVMGLNPEPGNIELRRAVANEILHFLKAIEANSPGVFDRMGTHPAQHGWWIANLEEALNGKAEPDQTDA